MEQQHGQLKEMVTTIKTPRFRFFHDGISEHMPAVLAPLVLTILTQKEKKVWSIEYDDCYWTGALHIQDERKNGYKTFCTFENKSLLTR